jgi:hypothetical protein
MLVLAGILIGGAYSFARHRQWLVVAVLASAAALCFAVAWTTAPR